MSENIIAPIDPIDPKDRECFSALTTEIDALLEKYGYKKQMLLAINDAADTGVLVSTPMNVSGNFLFNGLNALLHSVGHRTRILMSEKYDLSQIGDVAIALGTLLAQLGPDGVRVMSEVARMPSVLSESTHAPEGVTLQ